ncbi:2-phosphosulfolactate phosphatase [Dysgonomonas sp. 216]|uniref:2-phosphosulfolactate phosphatase n=1 Tax=Dysgonomonas sp. 216 TaxID=2302934 RepID=UPI0013D1FAB5|nr:2-phosphosulfolactate phosphatase [Dysgonomonas sp. 216]NDW19094.1 2-phosphosulfolactate phosphatase [Dysgonomonas sp. 216]
MKKIDVCFSPMLYNNYVDGSENNTVVIVVDVFRATTSMCAAINNGARSIVPVRTPEEAFAYKQKGFLVGGESNMQVFDFGDFGNSPSDYIKEKVKDRDIVISTTNGTRAIDEARESYSLVIGSFSNISTVVRYCVSQKKDVLVLCAGWKDKFNFEDSLFGGAMVEKLMNEGFNASFDAAQVALGMWQEAKPDIMTYVQRSEHFKRLEAHGLLDVAEYCLTSDTTDVLPLYNRDTKSIVNSIL